MLPEEKLPVVQIPKQDEKVNEFIQETLKEKEEFPHVIKDPLADNKEVSNVKAQKEKTGKMTSKTFRKRKQSQKIRKKKEVNKEYKLLMCLLLCQVYLYYF